MLIAQNKDRIDSEYNIRDMWWIEVIERFSPIVIKISH